MGFLDMLLILAYLLGGLCIMQALHHAGFHGLPALVMAMVVLWVVGSVLSTVVSTITTGWLRLTEATGDVLPALFGALLLVLLAFLAWRLWMHWRARQYFDF